MTTMAARRSSFGMRCAHCNDDLIAWTGVRAFQAIARHGWGRRSSR